MTSTSSVSSVPTPTPTPTPTSQSAIQSTPIQYNMTPFKFNNQSSLIFTIYHTIHQSFILYYITPVSLYYTYLHDIHSVKPKSMIHSHSHSTRTSASTATTATTTTSSSSSPSSSSDTDPYIQYILDGIYQQDISNENYEYELTPSENDNEKSKNILFQLYKKMGHTATTRIPICIAEFTLTYAPTSTSKQKSKNHHDDTDNPRSNTIHLDLMLHLYNYSCTLHSSIHIYKNMIKDQTSALDLLNDLYKRDTCKLDMVKRMILEKCVNVLNTYKKQIREIRNERDEWLRKRDTLLPKEEEEEIGESEGEEYSKRENVRGQEGTTKKQRLEETDKEDNNGIKNDDQIENSNDDTAATTPTEKRAPSASQHIDAGLIDDSQAYDVMSDYRHGGGDDLLNRNTDISTDKSISSVATEKQPHTAFNTSAAIELPALDDIFSFDNHSTTTSDKKTARPNVRKRRRIPPQPVNTIQTATSSSSTRSGNNNVMDTTDNSRSNIPKRTTSRASLSRGSTALRNTGGGKHTNESHDHDDVVNGLG